jgi:cytochrome P450
MTASALPPGPRFALLQAAGYMRNPLSYLEGLQRRWGNVFSVPYPTFGRLVYVAEPDAIEKIFKGDPADYHAGEGNAGPLEPLMGSRSVFVLDEAEHMRERKLLLPRFHGKRIERYAEVMADLTAREVERWPVGERFALLPRMQWLGLEVLLRTVFGVDDPARLALYHERVPHMGKIANLVVWVPATRRDLGRFSPWARFVRARAAVHELIYDEIDRARRDPALEERQDILALLLQARHDDGSPMSRDELRDELMTVIAAGHETTATALSWLFERTLRHPQVEERLRAEIEAGDDAYIDATATETLRSRPIVTDIIRRVKRDVEVAGWKLPAETFTIPSIALVHLREDIYPEPHAFRPERFLGVKPGTYTWLPFGGGVRRCIGAPFAMLELRTIARTVFENVRLRAADQRPETPRARHVTIAPARGAEVVLEERLRRRSRPLAAAATPS